MTAKFVAVSTLLLATAAVAETLTVISWGGSYARASKAAVMDPFTAETGIDIRLGDYNGGLAEVRAQVETGNVHWDIVDIEVPDLVRGCDEGLFEPVDIAAIPPGADGTPATEDFPPGTVSECGPGHLTGATIYAYHAESYPDAPPASLEDFFDLERFPGRRGLRRSPLSNMEKALMADGVPVDEVYATLSTPEGVDRAFRKLDAIKDVVIWWDAGAQPPQMLADREVAMTTAYNGRIFNAQVLEKQPFTIVWDGQVHDVSSFGIVAGSPAAAAARRFIAFAARPEVMANVSRYISYGPVRLSAQALVSTHLATGIDMIPHLATSPQNRHRALRRDWRWWGDHADQINERFAAWLVR